MRSARTKQYSRLIFNVHMTPVLVFGDAFLAQKPHLVTKTESYQGGSNSPGSASTSSTYPNMKGHHGGQCSWCVTVNIFFTITFIHCTGLYTSKTILDQWRGLTFNWLVFNMVKGHHLQLRCHPLLFHIFTWFNIKANMVHHPIIQKEVDELLAKGSTEPWMGCPGFYLTWSNLIALYTYPF